jgi:hypothetical protein
MGRPRACAGAPDNFSSFSPLSHGGGSPEGSDDMALVKDMCLAKMRGKVSSVTSLHLFSSLFRRSTHGDLVSSEEEMSNSQADEVRWLVLMLPPGPFSGCCAGRNAHVSCGSERTLRDNGAASAESHMSVPIVAKSTKRFSNWSLR